jgi:hypothetical protein
MSIFSLYMSSCLKLLIRRDIIITLGINGLTPFGQASGGLPHYRQRPSLLVTIRNLNLARLDAFGALRPFIGPSSAAVWFY